MNVLEVLPTYPGEPYDGSAVYERNLNRALMERGVRVEVLTTRARRLRHDQAFSIGWPNDLPTRDEHDGVPIRRFSAIDTSRIGRAASEAIVRRWSREDFLEGAIVGGSARFTEAAVAQARRRPARFDLLADLGRGPLAPGLIAHLLRHAASFDVILAGYAPFSLPRQVLWAGARVGVPVVLLPFIHENDRYHQFTSLLRGYEQAAAVLTLSSHTSDFLRAYVPGANPVALGAGLTVPSEGAISASAFRARHRLGTGPLVLYVGRKERGKRYDLAIDAVEMLKGEATLVMVGRDADGLPIDSPDVRYLGTLSDEELAAAYAACDVLTLPSTFESFGMVFLDAWLAGKPVIGNSTCGAAVSLIEDGVDGFLCADAKQIATVLRRLLADADLTARMGAAGRAKALAEYTWGRVAERALAVLEEVTSTPVSSSSSSSRRGHDRSPRQTVGVSR